MGAWGYGSFENDAALDFIADLINEKAVKKLVHKKKREPWDYDEARVTAEILLHLSKVNNLWFEEKTINGLIDVLESALNDEEWIGGWDDDGEEVSRNLKRLIRGLKKMEGY